MLLTPGAAYTAMGSSFAAGPGLRPRATASPRRSGRSALNYPHLLARRYGLDLDDVTYSGATTHELVTSSRSGVPPQVHAIHERTRLITITSGGNDVGYVPTLTLGSLPRPLQATRPVRRRLDDALDASRTAARLLQLRRSLDDVISTARRRAPQSRLFVVGYLTIMPPDDINLSPHLSARVADWARTTAAGLRAVWAAASDRDGVEFVDVGELSIAHHPKADAKWVREFHYSLRGGAPYHPTAAGMQAVADAVSTAIERP